jgi:hypothetical protein
MSDTKCSYQINYKRLRSAPFGRNRYGYTKIKNDKKALRKQSTKPRYFSALRFNDNEQFTKGKSGRKTYT